MRKSYTRLFGYLICFAFLIFALISMASQATLMGGALKAANKQINSTVEIHVERAFDADMGVYDYQLVGKTGSTKIKRGRKRMSQLSEHY